MKNRNIYKTYLCIYMTHSIACDFLFKTILSVQEIVCLHVVLCKNSYMKLVIHTNTVI